MFLNMLLDRFYQANTFYEGDFIFVLGSGRSGNTLLRKLLVEWFPVYIPAETYVIADSLYSFNRSRQLSWPARVRLVLSAFEYQEDFYTISRKSLHPVYQECLKLPSGKQSYGEILLTMWKFLAHDAGVDFLIPGDKTPYNMASINLIKRSFPYGHYIFIARHPYDVCASYIKMGRYDDLKSAAQRWNMAHQNWLKMIKRSPCLKTKTIRYERLVSNPEGTMNEIGIWLNTTERTVPLAGNIYWGDMDVYEHISDAKADVSTNSIGKGSRFLNKADKSIIRDIVRGVSIEFGYNL